MFVAPTSQEYVWVYGPMGVMLAIGVIVELVTERIPNALSIMLLVYLAGVRIVLGPDSPWMYVVSASLTAFLTIGLAFPRCMGAGAVKLAIAVSMGLEIHMTFTACACYFLLYGIAWLAHRLRGWELHVPGTVTLLAFTAVAVAMATLTSPQAQR